MYHSTFFVKRGLLVALLLSTLGMAFTNCGGAFETSPFSEQANEGSGAARSAQIQELESRLAQTYTPVTTRQTAFTSESLGSCTAKNKSEWELCKSKLLSGLISDILIDGQIDCTDASCRLEIANINRLVLTATKNGKFVRTGGYEAPLLALSGIKDLVLDGIRIFETENTPVQLNDNYEASPGEEEKNAVCIATPNRTCRPTVEVNSSQDVQIRNCSFENGKVFNLQLWGNYAVNVHNSKFSKSFTLGVWGRHNQYLTFTSNVFERNRANGFLIDFGDTLKAEITDNYFSQNHYATAYHVCGNGKSPCSGGQTDILGHIKDMRILRNKFINAGLTGEFPEDLNHGLYVTNLEFEGSEKILYSVLVDDNYFANGDSGFFHINTPHDPGANHLQFSNNKYCQMPNAHFNFNSDSKMMSNTQEICVPEWNQLPQPNLASLKVTGQTFAPDVSLESSHCLLLPGKTQCSSTVTWKAPNFASACVFVGDNSLFACQGPVSSKQMPWVGVDGLKVQLRAGSQGSSPLLAELTVRAVENDSLIPDIETFSWVSSPWGVCDASPVYAYGPWSECVAPGTQSRGSQCTHQLGQQTRSVTCKSSSGQAATNASCSSLPRPLESQECRAECAGQPQTAQSCDYIDLQVVATVFVAGVWMESTHCILPPGQSQCSSTVSWSAPDHPSACLFVGEGSLFACQGPTSSKIMPWVGPDGIKVELKETSSASSKTLASFVVKAIAGK